MPPEIRIAFEHGIIRVTYRGMVQFELMTQMLREAVRVGAENGSKLLLFDAREMESPNYHSNAIVQANQAPALGLDQTFRVAFLGAENVEMVRYYEDVAVNRGFRAKAFTDEAAAVAWLRGEP